MTIPKLTSAQVAELSDLSAKTEAELATAKEQLAALQSKAEAAAAEERYTLPAEVAAVELRIKHLESLLSLQSEFLSAQKSN